MKDYQTNPLQLKSLNHISILCSSLEDSIDFYQNVLGFFPVLRPGSLSFEGAWYEKITHRQSSCVVSNCNVVRLIGFGVGIHLLKVKELASLPKKREINPLDRHISFQCDSMWSVEKKLKEMEIHYVRATVEEDGCFVDQLFFHDPDGFMIEICNCDNLPVVPVTNDMVRQCRLGFGKPLVQES